VEELTRKERDFEREVKSELECFLRLVSYFVII